MSKILANQIANYGDDAPIEIKEGLNIPAGKPIQAAGDSGTAGQILTSTGASIEWTDNFSGSYTDLTNKPTIPAAQVNSDWNATSGVSRILNKPIVPAQPSVTISPSPSGNGNLAYNPLNGQFTFTQPDISGLATSVDLSNALANSNNWDTAYSWGNHASAGYALNSAIANSSNWDTAYGWGNHATAGYLTSYTETDPVFAASDAAAVTSTKISNWDTSYGWGDHSTQGYLTSLAVEDLSNVDVTAGLSDQQVLKWDSASSSWKPANDLVGGAGGIELADLSVSTAASGTPSLAYNNTNGVFTYTPPDLSVYLTAETDPVFSAHVASGILQTNINNWNTAYGWGNHATAGYVTTNSNPVFDSDFASEGLMKRGATGGSYSIVTDNSANWDTAYGWGNHASAGYWVENLTKISNWDTAYGWGNHASAGYLTSYTVSSSDLNSISIDALSDVDTTTSPVNGYALLWDSVTSNWKPGAVTLPGAANVTVSDTPPGLPDAGDLWWESDKGRLKIYYQDVDSAQWVDASPPLSNPLSPVAAGYINMNGTSPTWSGTTGYSISGAQPGGAGTDYVYTLTFPSTYSARTDYIVQATYDGTNYISSNSCELAVARGTASVVFTPRRLDGQPLNQGEIMVTITNL